jgi:putative methyltransferase (TIGR04325 family)
MRRILRIVPRPLGRLFYDQTVRRGRNWKFWGAFPDRETAVGAAPRRRDLPIGYDNPGIAEVHAHVYERMHLFDYPPMFWIERFVADGARRLVDLGGHWGTKRRVYSRLIDLPDDLTWVVCETPQVVALGRTRDVGPSVTFTSDLASIGGADILFASGVLQYLDRPLKDILENVGPTPRWLVLNKVPLCRGPEVWTLENVARAIAPYHIFNREAFLRSMEKLCYRVLDEWEMPYGVEIPFHPGVGTQWNRGMVLERS